MKLRIAIVTRMLTDRCSQIINRNMSGKLWEGWELQILRDNCGKMAIEEVAKMLPDRTMYALYAMASSLGLTNKNGWTESEEQILRDNLPRLSTEEVAKMLPGRTVSGTRSKALKLGLPLRRSCWAEAEDEVIKSNFPRLTARQITNLLPGRTYQSVCKRISKIGMSGDQWACKYSANQKFFSEPNILNSYWAGLIAADGCVVGATKKGSTILVISLTESDKPHLEQCAKDAEFTGIISVYKRNEANRKNKPFAMLSVSCAQDWFPDLEKHFSITPRKSLTLKPPRSLNRECSLAFIKGYFDGDGCVHFTKDGYMRISFCGTQEVLTWIQSICNEVAPNYDDERKKGRKHAQTRRVGNYCAYSMGDYRSELLAKEILKLPLPGLVRKWDRIKSALAEREFRLPKNSEIVEIHPLHPQLLYLGRLCRRGHDYQGTNKSLRHRRRGSCVKCIQQYVGTKEAKIPTSFYFEQTSKLKPELEGTPFYLGKLCTRNHDYEGLGYSLKYRSSRGCCECDRLKRSLSSPLRDSELSDII